MTTRAAAMMPADIVHEAFVRARVFPGSFRHQASTATWMTRILLNAAIDETRRMKRRPSCVSDPDASLIERGGVPLHVARLDLKAALAASNGIDREVLVLAACAVRSRGLPTDEPLVLSGRPTYKLISGLSHLAPIPS